jgi:hypothetical protein
MARSGSVTDSAFADGFLTAVRRRSQLSLHHPLDHWRPIADLPLPFGRVIGDLGLLFDSQTHPAKTVLIVEREGSGPGNERNILKWFQAIRGSHLISLDAHGQKISCEQAVVMLLLAFCRPSGWPKKDFDKTFAFCEVLAHLANESAATTHLPMTTLVQRYPAEVDDWKQCGRYFAEQVLQQV